MVNDEQVTPQARHRTAEERSILQSLENLRSFPFVKAREEAGDLRLFGGWFDVGAGQVWIVDETSGEFGALDDAVPRAKGPSTSVSILESPAV